MAFYMTVMARDKNILSKSRRIKTCGDWQNAGLLDPLAQESFGWAYRTNRSGCSPGGSILSKSASARRNSRKQFS